EAVVAAVDVPVTLKIRTGWDADHRNAPAIARIAEESGVAALAIHGRTRDQHYAGQAEYDTIAAIKARVSIPVIANGDIDSPEKARAVLDHTGADAVMVGRAAQGRPWIFGAIAHYLATGEHLPEPGPAKVRDILLGHLEALHAFYGEQAGVRIARKHLGWYAKDRPENRAFLAVVNRAETAQEQLRSTRDYYAALAAGEYPELPAADTTLVCAAHRGRAEGAGLTARRCLPIIGRWHRIAAGVAIASGTLHGTAAAGDGRVAPADQGTRQRRHPAHRRRARAHAAHAQRDLGAEHGLRRRRGGRPAVAAGLGRLAVRAGHPAAAAVQPVRRHGGGGRRQVHARRRALQRS